MAPARTLASSAASDASPIRASAARTAKCKHKPKGIPRAKTGCYTCRIRRKKCDEDADEERGCQTCVRLRLQCLGFGDKRPGWLKDQGTLTQTREKIRAFLTQKGLVKGQTHVASRNEDSGDVLMLEPDSVTASAASGRSSSSQSPAPSISLSASSDEQLKHEVSNVRDEVYTAYDLDPAATELPLVHTGAEYPIVGNSTVYHVDPYPAASSDNPAMQSGFGPLYHYDENLHIEAEDFNCMHAAVSPTMLQMAPFSNGMEYFFPEPWQHDPLRHYYTNVVKIQYMLADPQVFQLIWQSLQQSKPAREGACMLSTLHRNSMQTNQVALLNWLESSARSIIPQHGCEDDGEAFAALQVVSGFLFIGGRGPWQLYLGYAVGWVERLFSTSCFNPEQTLTQRTELERFVIKTTMWFDVLGSVTQAQPPRLLALFRRLFHSASIDDGQSTASMIPVMGCEKEIVLALGEISALAHWKNTELKAGRLSNPRLVKVGEEIEKRFLSTPTPYAYAQCAPDTTAQCRALTSAVFRASARVYLHTVLSGDAPACPEIAAAVTDTVDALRQIPAGDVVAERSVVRMVVFSICLAGCLTDSREQREFLLQRLAAQLDGEAVGNCAEVRKVMETVWARRAASAGAPVSWREVMAESPEGLLLLV